MKKLFIVVIVLTCFLSSSYSQITDPKIEKVKPEDLRVKVIVYLKSGEVYKGYFIAQNKDFLEIENETVGKITIATNQIKSIESDDSKGKAKMILELDELKPINSAKYFFGSAGFNFEKGGDYLSNNVMTYHRGISENFSIGVGTSLFTLVLGAPIFYVNPHYTYSFQENIHFKAGMDAFIGFGEGEAAAAGFLNTGLTLGNPDINITGTIYYGAVSDVGFVDQPAFSVAGLARISKKLSLISENLIFSDIDSEGYFIGSYGIRYMTINGSYDLFFINNRDIAEVFVVGFPGIGFTLKL
ncbi:hypothetical protein GCM10011506_07940 [Marivirga lumbricoides]|uniref:Uncharacterized protein n=1 Tax=Marivirga lumbricoides TaxID=1046115 RepID=A0ABQ1LKC7_9BACT|nr:hypothetical protein GCM10011506_07940 [Marivirga lumbricoides]